MSSQRILFVGSLMIHSEIWGWATNLAALLFAKGLQSDNFKRKERCNALLKPPVLLKAKLWCDINTSNASQLLNIL